MKIFLWFHVSALLFHHVESATNPGLVVPGKGTPPVEIVSNISNITNATNTTQHAQENVSKNQTEPIVNRSGWRPVAHAAHQDIVVPQNGRRRIELLEEFTIPDGESELLLPIEVEFGRLTVDGSAPPRIVLVNSTSEDEEYGAGQEINITLRFTTDVDWRPYGVSDSERWLGSDTDVPQRWVISGTNKHMFGTASNEYGYNTQWSNGPHPTTKPIPMNASIPTLRLATGCLYGGECMIHEIQLFYCVANHGKLSILWNGHYRTNVDVDSTQEELKRVIETFPGIARVTVSYSTPMGDPEYGRMCSSRGNNVTVIFEDARVQPFSEGAASADCNDFGDIPELEFDQYNSPQDPATGLSEGDGTFLNLKTDNLFDDHLQHGRPLPSDVEGVTLSGVATEVRKGRRVPDRNALLLSREDAAVDGLEDTDSNASVLIFKYTVCEGDSSSDLEFRSQSSLVGEGLVDALTGVSVNLTLPQPGFGGSYRHHGGESLSARRNIRINTQPPQVMKITSPMSNGVYGEGDVLEIDVVFDKDISVGVYDWAYDNEETNKYDNSITHSDITIEHETKRGIPYLLLVVGRLSESIRHAQLMWHPPSKTENQYTYLHKAYFNKIKDGNIVSFRYEVLDLDYSLKLDYLDQNALKLNGGWIRRLSTTPTTNVDITLPPPGGINSLSGNKHFMIYPMPARVVSVIAVGGSESYGAFEVINIEVQFGWGLLSGWRGPDFLTPIRELTNRYGVPVTLSPNAEPKLELKLDVVPMASVWSITNGSNFAVLEEGSGIENSWALDIKFQITVLGYTQIIQIVNASTDYITFTPNWNGHNVQSGYPVGNVTTLDVRNASYSGGNNTDTLIFEYLTLPGDRTSHLDYTSSQAFLMSPNSTLLRLSTKPSTPVNTTLVPPGTCSENKAFGCSLSSSEAEDSVVEIEARSQSEFRPKVVSLSTTKRGDLGPFGVGEPIEVVVSFNKPVAVSSNDSAPVLRLSPGGFATYGYGSGTSNLTFWYVIGQGDNALILESYEDGYANSFDVADSRLTPLDIFFMGHEEGWIRRDSNSPLTPALLLPSHGGVGSLGYQQRYKNDRITVCTTDCSKILKVKAIDLPNDKDENDKNILGVGHVLLLEVTFNQEVYVNTTFGTPYIELSLGNNYYRNNNDNDDDSGDGVVVDAMYLNGSNTNKIYFKYTILENDPYTNPVIIHQRSDDLTLTTSIMRGGGDIITKSTGRRAVLTLRRIGYEKALRDYQLDMKVAYSKPGFENPFSPDPALVLRRQNIIINTSPAYIHTVEAEIPKNSLVYGSVFGAGNTIYFRLHFTVAVVVRPENNTNTSYPQLELETSGYRSSIATYVGGSGSNILRFKYVTSNNEYTADLDYVTSASSLIGGMILTDSDDPFTPINRTLPRNGAPGSLGVQSNIGIDTSPPKPIAVYSSIPPGVHGLRSDVQTIELSWDEHDYTSYTSSSSVLTNLKLIRGQFKLVYGSEVTSCINVNASSNDLMKALKKLGPFVTVDGGVKRSMMPNITITKEATPHQKTSTRFVVDLSSIPQTYGIQPLQVLIDHSSCHEWMCMDDDDNDDELHKCEKTFGDIVEFRNDNHGLTHPSRGGYVEVTVRYDKPVTVYSDILHPPVLPLNIIKTYDYNSTSTSSSSATYHPNATYAEGSLTQVIDVGVDASSPLTAGQFKLQYGGSNGPVTGCIYYDAATSAVISDYSDHKYEREIGGYRNMRTALEHLQPIALIGLEDVIVKKLVNGTRFIIKFNPGSNPLKLEPVNINREECQDFIPSDANVTIPPSSDVTFRYLLKQNDLAYPSLAVASTIKNSNEEPSSIILKGGNSTIKRTSENPITNALLNLPTAKITPISNMESGFAPFMENIIIRKDQGGSINITVDCSIAPHVINISTASWGDSYGVGEWIDFYITFSGPVIAPEGSVLLLNTKSSSNNNDDDGYGIARLYKNNDNLPVPGYVVIPPHLLGNGTSSLRFHYRIQEGDSTSNLVPASSVSLIGKITSALYSQWNLVDTYLSSNGTNSTNNGREDGDGGYDNIDKFNYTVDGLSLMIETSIPQITKIEIDKINGTYSTGEEIYILVHFDKPVSIEGNATLKLSSGGIAYLSRNGGNLQIFDIGVDASKALEHYCCGKFTLGLGNDITRCMQWDNPTSIMRGIHTLNDIENSGALNPWPNPFQANGIDYHGGYRWSLQFPNGGKSDYPYPSPLIPLDQSDNDCTMFDPPGDDTAIVKIADSNIIAFRYIVQPGEESGNLAPLNENAIKLFYNSNGQEEDGEGKLQGSIERNYSNWFKESYVRRASTTPLQDVNLTIPFDIINGTNNTSSSSSQQTKDSVIVNGTAAKITEVISVNGGGSFTQGDVIDLLVKFDKEVWLVDYSTGTDFETGRIVTTPTHPHLIRPSPSSSNLNFEGSCEGSAGGSDVLTLALDTIRADKEEVADSSITNMTQNGTNSINGTTINDIIWSDDIARASYVNGSGTQNIYFKYTVRSLEATDGFLEYANFSALQLKDGYGLIVRSTYSSHKADLHLPKRGYYGSLSYDQNITLISSARENTFVRKITADVPEGCYDPGKVINIHILFSRCVRTPNSLDSDLSIQLNLITGVTTELIAANDTKGRDFAEMIIFPWIVGHDEHTLKTITQTNSLFISTNKTRVSTPLLDVHGHAVNLTLPVAGTINSLDDSVIIAVHHGSKFKTVEKVYITPKPPRALYVSTNTPPGIYGAGNMIEIIVTFSDKVTLHCISSSSKSSSSSTSLSGSGDGDLSCPSLSLRTKGSGSEVIHNSDDWFDEDTMSLAHYLKGNNTKDITFIYTVKPGDQTNQLDYVDTRPAARTQKFSRAIIVPCDQPGKGCVRQTGDGTAARLVLSKDENDEDSINHPEVNVVSFLPVPRTNGSLTSYNITLDTTIPYILEVTSPARDGVYEPIKLVNDEEFPKWESSFPVKPKSDKRDQRELSRMVRDGIAIDIHFSSPVAVSQLPQGCALELDMDIAVHRFLSQSNGPNLAGSNGALQNVVAGRRVAIWYGKGNGTSILRMHLPIYPGDYSPLLDYASPHALGVQCAHSSNNNNNHDVSYVYRDAADYLITPVNLTLPIPGPRTTIVGPVSLVGAGHDIAIQGDSCCHAISLSCSHPLISSTTFEENNVGEDYGTWGVFKNGKAKKRPVVTNAFYAGMDIVVYVHFASKVTVQPRRSIIDLGVRLRLRIASNSFTNGTHDTISNNSDTSSSNSSSSSSSSSSSISNQSHANAKRFNDHVPTVEALLTGGNNTDTLEFTYTVQPGDTAGYLDVANESAFISNIGDIMVIDDNYLAAEPNYARFPKSFNLTSLARRAVSTRLPIWPSSSSLARSCLTSVDGSAPRVLTVKLGIPDLLNHFYQSNNSSSSYIVSYTGGEKVPVVVVFSGPITLEGSATLYLKVSDVKNGIEVMATESDLDETATELTFWYTVQPGHYSSNLDYPTRDSLKGNITSRYYEEQYAELQLPNKKNSLSTKGTIIIDTTDAIVVSITGGDNTCDGIYGASEEINLFLTFNHPVILVPRTGVWNNVSSITSNVISNSTNSTQSNSTTSTNTSSVNNNSTIESTNDENDEDSNENYVPPYMTLELDTSGVLGNINITLTSKSFNELTAFGTQTVVFSGRLHLTDGTSRLDYTNRYALSINSNAGDAKGVHLARAPISHLVEHLNTEIEFKPSPSEFNNWDPSHAVDVNLELPERGTNGSLGNNMNIVIDPPLIDRPYIWLVAMDKAGTNYADYEIPSWLANDEAAASDVIGVDGDFTEIGYGDSLLLRLRFTERVVVHGIPSFNLSGGASIATYSSGNLTDELIFEYSVLNGDEDTCVSALEGALRCGCQPPECRIEGLDRTRTRPRSIIRGDAGGSNPLSARLRLPLQWPSFTRHASVFMAEYRHTSPGPKGTDTDWIYNTSNIVNVTQERANGTLADATRLLPSFIESLPDSSFFSDGLSRHSADLFSKFATVAVSENAYTGEPATYERAQGCVMVKTDPVYVAKVSTTHEDGTWGAGEVIFISIHFSGPVMLVEDSTARLRLEVGDTVIDRTSGPVNATTDAGEDQGAVVRKIGFAEYAGGNNTARMIFRYEVAPGDSSVNLDVDASACRAVCISAGIGIDNFPFKPYAFPAGCHELLSEGVDLTLFNNYSQRSTSLPTNYGKYNNFLASSALELNGRLVRRAARIVDDVDITIPCPGTPGSLSASHELVIDTVPPSVDFIVSLRTADVYHAGEMIDLQVVFNKPVTVDGPPGSIKLALNIRNTFIENNTLNNNTSSNNNNNNTNGGVNSTSSSSNNSTNSSSTSSSTIGIMKYAIHDPKCSMRSEGFSYEDSSVCFTYKVEHGDIAYPFLSYNGPYALELNNGSIYRTATVLTGHATTLLPVDNHGIDAMQHVSALQVRLSGLSHDDSSDLQIAVEHAGYRSTLMDYRLSKRGDLRLGPVPAQAFSDYPSPAQSPSPVPYTSPGDNTTSETPTPSEPWNELRHASGGGSTYYFGDTTGRNLAQEGRACQSSTRYGAYASRAIDGNKNPYLVSGGSVTHTGGGSDDLIPWWQLSLRRPNPIGTIRVWSRQPEIRVSELQYIHLHAFTPLSRKEGTFRLEMTGTDVGVSDPIGVDAVSKIEEESQWPPPPIPEEYPTSSMDRFKDPEGPYCTERVNCAGDSVQAKIEELLKRAYPLVAPGTLSVEVDSGSGIGTTAGTSSYVAHPVEYYSPEVDMSNLPPSTSEESPDGSDRAVLQKDSLSPTPGEQLHWSAKRGDFDRKWRVTFVGAMGDLPEMRWPAGDSLDANDGPEDERRSHIGGLTALGANIQISTIRNGAHAPAPHGRDDQMKDVGAESSGFRPGEATTGPVWLLLFNTTEPPPRGIDIEELKKLAIWSTFLDESVFSPLSSTGEGTDINEGGGSRSVAVVRVPGIWCSHLRIQRGDERDVVTAAFVKKMKIIPDTVIEEANNTILINQDAIGVAFESGDGTYTPLHDVRRSESVNVEETDEETDTETESTSSSSLFDTYDINDSYRFAPLAIAEVEVFEEVNSPMHEYQGSSPLPPSIGSSPLAPAIEPLSTTFESISATGLWVLSVRDRIPSKVASLATPQTDDNGNSLGRDLFDRNGWGRKRRVHGVGTIGRWELHLTDILGFGHSFYMDTTLHVTHLPKFGHLFVDEGGGKEIELLEEEEGQGEWRSGCAGIDTTGMDGIDAARVYRECSDSFGVGRKKGTRLSGSTAVRRPLRGGAHNALVYVPRVDFTGLDQFAFKVSAGSGLSPTEGIADPAYVDLRVRSCRKRGGPYFPTEQLGALCTCASPLLFVETSAREACFEALTGACTEPRSTLTSESADARNDTRPQSTVEFAYNGDGRCDPITGICAPGLPDKVINDPRPRTASWIKARSIVSVGFERMCRACEGSSDFSHLRPRCWAEWLNTMQSFGLRVDVGGQATCEADVVNRGSFDQVRCTDDNHDMPMGYSPEPRLGRGNAKTL